MVRRSGIRAERGILFGSHARGDARPDSDVDVLIVASEFDEPYDPRRINLINLLWELRAYTDSRIEPIAVGERQWREDRSNPLIEIACREGVVVAPMMPDLEQLRTVFASYPQIQAVYLFGSAVTGRLRPESDIDLAIVARMPGVRSRKLDLLTDLARAGFCDVDLVFLDEADVVTQYEAVRHNRLIYAAEDFDRGALYARVVGRYLDFLPYLAVQRAAYKERILSGQG